MWHRDRAEFQAFAGEKCSIQGTGMQVVDGNVHMMRNAHEPNNGMGLSLDPEMLVTGSNSGFQALNFAVLAGAKTVLLLGYDAREPSSGKPSHWFGEHPEVAPIAAFADYRRSCTAAAVLIKAAGVRVLNCSPGSAIDCFERMDLDQALRL